MEKEVYLCPQATITVPDGDDVILVSDTVENIPFGE